MVIFSSVIYVVTYLCHVDKSNVGHLVETARTRKRSRWNLAAQSNDKGYEGLEAPKNGTEVTRSLDLEGRQNKGISYSSSNLCSEKVNIQSISWELFFTR